MPSTQSRRRAVAVVLTAIILLAGLPGVASAETRAGGTVVVDAGETVDGLSAFGGNVIVRGTVNGDLEAFAGNVEISGEVTGDVEAAAGNVEISGEVGGDVEAAGGSIVVAESAVIDGSVEGGAGEVAILGTVGGDVRVGAERLVLGEGAQIGGDVVYDAELVDRGATVGGAVTFEEGLSTGFQGPVLPGISGAVFSGVLAIYGFLLNLALGALLLVVAPAFSGRVAENLDEGGDVLRSGLVGLAAVVLVPVALVLVAITVIGIPVTVLGLFAFLFALWAGYVLAAFALGDLLVAGLGSPNRWLGLVVGLLIVSVVGFVPVVGGLLQFLVVLAGLGALVFALRGARRDREEPDVAPAESTGTDEAA